MKWILLIACCASIALSQEQSPAPQPESRQVDYSTRSGLGFCGGATSGIGFAYRRHFQSRWGIHIGAFGLGGSDEDYYLDVDKSYKRSWAWFNLGVQGMYTLHRHPAQYFRFYALAGAETIMYSSNAPVETYNPGTGTWTTTQPEWVHDPIYIVGAGLGFEFLFARHIGLSLELPLSVQFTEHGFHMYPIGNASLIYFF